MLPVDLTAYVQQMDQQQVQSNIYESKILTYKNPIAPVELQGAWKLIESSDQFSNAFLYITLRRHTYLMSLDLLAPRTNILPSDYSEYLVSYNSLSSQIWTFIATGHTNSWKEGQIEILDEYSIKVRTRNVDVINKNQVFDRTATYKRITPRPGPFFIDFFAGQPFIPPELAGCWISTNSDGPPQQIELKPISPINQIGIHFKYITHYASPKNETITWSDGVFIPWGLGHWWFRTGFGSSGREVHFELTSDGRLCVSQQPLAEEAVDSIPPRKIFYRKQ